ncbi:MAG: glycoside hydrolase family 3 C-terminal domain-containing protein, partial [Oscillospiraceae bacterium]|nr:glycoside hydrolase family 3 C-terminal domain-containing protein [Oscillospiraceae bacterium]
MKKIEGVKQMSHSVKFRRTSLALCLVMVLSLFVWSSAPSLAADSEAPALVYGDGWFGPQITVTHPWISAANVSADPENSPHRVAGYYTADGTVPTEDSPGRVEMSNFWGFFVSASIPPVSGRINVLLVLDAEDGKQYSEIGHVDVTPVAPTTPSASGLYAAAALASGIRLDHAEGARVRIHYTTGLGAYDAVTGTVDTSGVTPPTEDSPGIAAGGYIPVVGATSSEAFVVKAIGVYRDATGTVYLGTDVAVFSYRVAETLPKLRGAENIDEVIAALSLEERVALTSGVGGDPTSLLNGSNFPEELNMENGQPMFSQGLPSGGPAGGTLAIPRFNIPSLVLADGPSGVRMWKNATVWMAPAGIGSTWNEALSGEIGARVAEEAKHYAVDIVLGPGLNMQRNPLGGRNFEYYSEDPYITGKSAAAYVEKIQAGGVGVSLKHYVANDSESNRGQGDMILSERALREIYLRGFEIAVEKKPWTIMTAYNKTNSANEGGRAMSGNKFLVTDVLRGEWGFDGFVMSDWGGDYVPPESLEAQMDLGENSRNTASVHAWIDDPAITPAERERRIGLVNRSVKNILNVLVKTSAFTGEYGELKEDGTYTELTQRQVSERSNAFGTSEVYRESAKVNKQAADEAIVLLKNAGGALPLAGTEKVALVTSPLAWSELFEGRWYNDSASVGDIVVQGTGSAQIRFNNNTTEYSPTLYDALEDRGFDVIDWRIGGAIINASGADGAARAVAAIPNTPKLDGVIEIANPAAPVTGDALEQAVTAAAETARPVALAAAAAADVGIYVLTRVAGEGADLTVAEFDLTVAEKGVLKAYSEAFRAAGKKLIVLLNAGSAVNTTEFRAQTDAILAVWNPGTEGTRSIADILKGAVNPSGKLAQTLPQTYSDSPSVAMRTEERKDLPFNSMPAAYYDEGVYVGYRYFESHPETYDTMVAYPFGYGLSYTSFSFSDLTLDKTLFAKDNPNETVRATVQVKNTGNVAGKEVVQLYLNADTWEAEGRPRQELKAYAKTKLLQPGESETVTLTLDLRDLQYFDDANPANDLSDVTYGNGRGWTVSDGTVFTVTVRDNAENAATPNIPIAGLTGTFVYG